MAKPNKYADAALKAQQQTDEEYQSVISGLTRLTDGEIDKLFPEKTDQDKLKELLALVNADTTDNQKIITLKENAEKFSAVMLKLVKILA